MSRQVVEHDADALRFGIMSVGELAHADGKVFCGAPLGDLDLAPGAVHVEEDEQVGGAVALVLAVVALELAWLGRDRLTDFADELDRLSSKQTTGRFGSGASA